MTLIERRRLLLAAAFVAALVSAVLAPSQETAPPLKDSAKLAPSSPAPQGPRTAPREAASRGSPREVEIPPVANYQRSIDEKFIVVDVFEARAIPVPPPPPPAKPEPPKLPFAYIGTIEESGRTRVVLLQGEQLFIVSSGERFAGSYRLEEADADKLVLTYLPLEARQSLPIGGGK